MRILLAVVACILVSGCQINDVTLPQKATQLPENLYESFSPARAQSYYIDYIRMRRGFSAQCDHTKPTIEIEPPELSMPLAKLHRAIALNTHHKQLDSLPNAYWAESLPIMLQKHLARVIPLGCFRTTRLASERAEYRLLSVVHDLSVFTDASGNGLRGVVDMEFWLLNLKSGQSTRWRISAQENITAPYDTKAAVMSLSKSFSRVVESNFIQMLASLQAQQGE